MLMRICLVIAILAGVAVGVLNFVTVKDKVTALMADRDNEKSQKETTQRELASTKSELKKTQTDLAQTKATLETTTQERDKAVADAGASKKLADQLTADLTKTKEERDSAQSELASYKNAGMTPQQIIGAVKQIKKLEDTVAATEGENKVLIQKVKKVENELARYKTPDYEVPLPASLQGKVLISDPKWNFVVLSVGEDQGVLEYGELLVNRKGRLVAKVKVSSVQKDRCVANVIQGWQLGDVLEGDIVIPAHPAS